MSTTLEAPRKEPAAVEAPSFLGRMTIPRWAWGLVVVAGWIVVWALMKGTDTLGRPVRVRTGLTDRLTGFNNDVLASRDTNPIIQFTYGVGSTFVDAVDWLQRLISIANLPRPVPEIGWLGVTVAAVGIALVIANWRIAVLVGASFVSFGLFGYWSSAMDLLIVTFVAVAVAVLVGMPVAIWIASSKRADRAVTVLLDLMQTMPTFVYLVPVVLFFGIGASAAVVCTLIYALPPIIRIAGHGIRHVSPTTIEATNSAGQTFWQRLVKVQLPMARATIVVGLSQTIMAALAMATIAAYVNGPGLGKDVLQALRTLNIGAGFVPGALIVVMAIMLDRAATAASLRSDRVARGHGESRRQRLAVIGVATLATAVAIYLSRYYAWAADFPENESGRRVADQVNSFTGWMVDTFGGITGAVKDGITIGLLNPLESLLSESPWYVAALAIVLLAFVIGGVRALVPTVVCLAGLRLLDYWNNSMVTLSMTLVATLMVMALAVVLGVWMARSRRVDVVLRPLLDAGQTIPPFVYLLPVLALFGNGKFTAIVAAIIYAAPAAIKLVADGVKSVPEQTVEASRSTGCTTWQEITKVQLPMARSSLVLATNQGLLYVLAMVVIGGLVGGGALGYDVVLGISRSEEWGRSALAGLSIVLLGIMVDRITRAAASTDRATDIGVKARRRDLKPTGSR
ncbi:MULTISPECIES: ABC transporter permease [Nocardioides]|uniref:ABC transporter permease n=1 Tax=Nocardioides vastitatis TaxID=2568655 RepID=A0ABW0ZHX1_9ACTN|nr:ABC transporter permease subunit [Nocardioides sp.]THI98342.1 ABC transporter permease subunit [Nocardioides sp.]